MTSCSLVGGLVFPDDTAHTTTRRHDPAEYSPRLRRPENLTSSVTVYFDVK
jgi:hypothetical protein